MTCALMSQTHTTAAPDAAKSSTAAHPPVPVVERAPAKQLDPAAAESKSDKAFSDGSPRASASGYGALLGATGRGGASGAGLLRQLQRSYGNGYVGAVIRRKCECGGACGGCEKKEPLRKGEGAAPSGVPAAADAAMRRSGPGQPLDASSRERMEAGFGHDFGGVRVHTDGAAAEAARGLRAQAFTTGQDIYFGSGRYQPRSADGERLLAHELTHVVQQGRGEASSSAAPKSAVSSPGDALELEADRAAELVTAGEAVSLGGAPRAAAIQRYSWDDFANDVESVGEAIEEGVEAVEETISEGVEAAEEIIEEGVEAAEEIIEEGVEAVEEGVEAVEEAAEEAVDWILTEAGQLALRAAQELAAMFGGSVTVVGTAIVITIPDMELCTPRSIPVLTLPMISIPIPLWGGAVMIGPVGIGGAVGIRLGAQPSLAVSYGPCRLRNMALYLDPIKDVYAGTAQLYIPGAVTETARLEGVGKAIGVIGLIKPPIALMASVEAGLRGYLRGIGAGAVEETVTVGYAGGKWSLNLQNVLMLGGQLELDLDIFANISLYEFVVCEWVRALGSWVLASNAERYELPVTVTSGGVKVGPVKSAPIPFSDIEVYVNRARLETRCLSLDQIIDELCKRGYLPPILCSKTPAGQKDVTASGRCKCVGEAACGGGRMYEVCYKTQADCKNAQKDLDNFCNNNEQMKERCTRPKCYYRHSQPKCPDECDPGTITPLAEPLPPGGDEPVFPPGGGPGLPQGGGGPFVPLNDCASPLNIAPVKMKVKGVKPDPVVSFKDAKHTRMAKKTLERILEVAAVSPNCDTLAGCEKDFCEAVKAGDTANWGGQIDNATREEERYKELIQNVFENKEPPSSGRWTEYGVADSDVGFDMPSKSATTKYTIHSQVDSGQKRITNTHLFPQA